MSGGNLAVARRGCLKICSCRTARIFESTIADPTRILKYRAGKFQDVVPQLGPRKAKGPRARASYSCKRSCKPVMQLKSVHPAKMPRRVNERARISSDRSRVLASVIPTARDYPRCLSRGARATPGEGRVVFLPGNEREKRAFRVAPRRAELFERERKWLSMRTGSSPLRLCCCCWQKRAALAEVPREG